MGKVSEILGGLGALIGSGFGCLIAAALREESMINDWIVWLPIFVGIAMTMAVVGVVFTGDIIPSCILEVRNRLRKGKQHSQEEKSTERTENPRPELNQLRTSGLGSSAGPEE